MRGIGWSQVRATIFFGLGSLSFSYLIDAIPVLQIMKAMPVHFLVAGDVIGYQIRAFVLLTAIVIANHAVD